VTIQNIKTVEIGEVLHDKSMGQLTTNLNLAAFKEDDVLLLAVNSAPQPVKGVAKFAVCTPREKAMFDIAIKDAKDNNYEVQAIVRKEENAPVQELAARPWAYAHDRSIVYGDLGEIPAGGYKVFKVEPVWAFHDRCEWWPKQTPTSAARPGSRAASISASFHAWIFWTLASGTGWSGGGAPVGVGVAQPPMSSPEPRRPERASSREAGGFMAAETEEEIDDALHRCESRVFSPLMEE